MSAEINASWPKENRFHFQVLDVPPILVVQLSIRDRDGFTVLGVTNNDSGTSGKSWHEVGRDDETGEHQWPASSIKLYPLKRGPSGNARFPARLLYLGCAGSYGVAYDAREWDPGEFGGLWDVIHQEGGFGLDEGRWEAGRRRSYTPAGVDEE